MVSLRHVESQAKVRSTIQIYNALVDPRKAEEIAKHCGVSKATVHRVISLYNRYGVSAVETPGKGGRRHVYLSLEEERQFLAPFFAHAQTGEIATAAAIQRAFEVRLGHEVDDSKIYRLLDRHGWRKLMPPLAHPKASKEAQEQFKKTLRRRFKRRSPHGHMRSRDLLFAGTRFAPDSQHRPRPALCRPRSRAGLSLCPGTLPLVDGLRPHVISPHRPDKHADVVV